MTDICPSKEIASTSPGETFPSLIACLMARTADSYIYIMSCSTQLGFG